MPDIYDSHYDCMEAGYEESLKKIKELGKEEVNKYGTLVKFFCAQTNMAEEENELIIPKPKPKIQSSIWQYYKNMVVEIIFSPLPTSYFPL